MTAPVADPVIAKEWEEFINGLDTPEKFSASFKDTGDTGFKAKLKAYVGAQNKERADIAAQLRETTQAAIVDMLRANGHDDKSASQNAKRLNHALAKSTRSYGAKYAMRHNPKSVAAKMDGEFEDLGEFVQSVFHKGVGSFANAQELAGKREIVNKYSIEVPDAGGFLVPEEFRAELLMLMLEDSIVLPRARVIPMSTQTLIFPTVDATSNVSSVFGGIVVYRTEEGAEFVESQAKFGKVKLDATKQTALAYLTNESIRDTAGALTAALTQMLPAAMAYNLDIDCLTALGAGEPLGAISTANPSLITISAESGQLTATIVWQNVLRAYARLLPQSIARSVWLASPDTFVELATMALNVGTGGSAVWITDGTGAPVLTLLGRPVIMTEKTPGVLGAQGDLSLVDFGFYLVGIRDTLTIDTSPHVKFTSDQTTVRCIQRNDGRPWLASPITPHNGGPTLSAFVTLASR